MSTSNDVALSNYIKKSSWFSTYSMIL
jgi:hypothetical protein